jgi:hypothetical protein
MNGNDWMILRLELHRPFALKKQSIPYAYKTRVGELLESDFSDEVDPIIDYFETLGPFRGMIPFERWLPQVNSGW